MTQNYDKFIDFPTLSLINEKKDTGLRKFQLWIYMRYELDGRLFDDKKATIAEFFGISRGWLNCMIADLLKLKLIEKEGGYYNAIGKVRFGERFAYLGTKKYAISLAEIKDFKMFRTYIYAVHSEQIAVKYGNKIDQETGELTHHIRTENRRSAELSDNKNEKPISTGFKHPLQNQSSSYLSKCLKQSPSTCNRHVNRAEKYGYLSVQKNLKFVTTTTIEKDGKILKDNYKGSWKDANRFLAYLKSEYKGYGRYFACKVVYDTKKKDENKKPIMSGYWGIACLEASTLTYSIEYKRTGLKYSPYQLEELENVKLLQFYKRR